MIGCFAAAADASTTCSMSKAAQHRHLPGGRMPARCPLSVLESTLATSSQHPLPQRSRGAAALR
jgi:hypothetical protein